MLYLFIAVVPSALAFDDPPFRVARLNFVEGQVSFQPGGETDWAWATVNRPMTAGDSLWTGDRSRAEMQIGSTAIRVGGQTSVSFLNLDDQTVQIQLNSGTVDVRVRNLYGGDVFEVDTPNLAFTVMQRGDYRITVDPNGSFTTITLRDGQGQITGGGQAFLGHGAARGILPGDFITQQLSCVIKDRQALFLHMRHPASQGMPDAVNGGDSCAGFRGVPDLAAEFRGVQFMNQVPELRGRHRAARKGDAGERFEIRGGKGDAEVGALGEKHAGIEP